jgi:hypothetical protein
MKNARLSYLLSILLLCECKPSNLRQTFSEDTHLSYYEEDLSLVRPKFSDELIEFSEEVTDLDINIDNPSTNVQSIHWELQSKIEAMVQNNQNISEVSGYRILVFVGNNKDEFESARAYILQNFQNAELYVSYSQPTYRLKMGDFTSKMDAERYFSLIKSRFPNCKIIPEFVSLKNSLKLP